MEAKTGVIYLVEGRPVEKGRCCIVEQRGTEWVDILPLNYNARSRVHEYGGGAVSTSPDGSMIFSDYSTNGVFRLKSADEVQPVVRASSKLRYADFDVHPLDTNMILAVQEDHSDDAVENRIVLINSNDQSAKVVCQGADFYCAPRFNHDGTKLCWIQWNHPDMPWNGSDLFVANWESGVAVNAQHIAGKSSVESVGQPKWHEDGTLFFSSDRTGFTQLYRLDATSLEVHPLVLPGWTDADLTPVQVLGKYVSIPFPKITY